jgi:hypothetical protein
MERKNKRETWNNFVSKLENDVTKPRPKSYKIIRALNNAIVDNVKLNPIKLESWLVIYKTYGVNNQKHYGRKGLVMITQRTYS